MNCPDENILAGYVDGGLRGEQRAALERHIDGCPACRAIVSDLARMKEQSRLPPAAFASGRPTAATIEYRVDRGIHLVPGTMVGEYEVTGSIGAGGMGAVFAAVHPRIGKKAAIKVLQRELADDPSAIVRFENEARAVNAIGHANIVDIFAFGELPDGNPYFVMEHVAGESLDKWLSRHPRLPLEQAMPILRQIFDALSAAHARGIIHRDLKPGNIMIAGGDDEPRVKVLDFGLAKIVRNRDSLHDVDDAELTMPGVAMGTPLFMSPEQYLGDNVDHRTDIYALGVIIFQMLCGEYPFVGTTPTAIGVQHISEPPRPPSSVVPKLSSEIDRAVIKALAKDPADRFASVAELRAALEDIVWASETEGLSTQPTDGISRPGTARPGMPRARTPRPGTPPRGMEQTELDHVGSAVTEHARAVLAQPQPALSTPPVTYRVRRRSWLVLSIAFVSTLVLGAIVFVALRGDKNPAATPHEATPQAETMPEQSPAPSAPAATPVASPPQLPPPPQEPPQQVRVKQSAQSGQSGHKVTSGGKTKPPPPIGTGSSGSGKRPCDPYKSLDGC